MISDNTWYLVLCILLKNDISFLILKSLHRSLICHSLFTQPLLLRLAMVSIKYGTCPLFWLAICLISSIIQLILPEIILEVVEFCPFWLSRWRMFNFYYGNIVFAANNMVILQGHVERDPSFCYNWSACCCCNYHNSSCKSFAMLEKNLSGEAYFLPWKIFLYIFVCWKVSVRNCIMKCVPEELTYHDKQGCVTNMEGLLRLWKWGMVVVGGAEIWFDIYMEWNMCSFILIEGVPCCLRFLCCI